MNRLIATLGPAVVQAMTGTKDPTEIESWETDGVPTHVQPQIDLANRILDIMLPVNGRNTTLAWMVGENPRLGMTPVTAVRDLNYEVIGAALTFSHDPHDGGYS